MSTTLLSTVAAIALSLGALAGSANAAPSTTPNAPASTVLAQASYCTYYVRYFEVDGVIYRQVIRRCYY